MEQKRPGSGKEQNNKKHPNNRQDDAESYRKYLRGFLNRMKIKIKSEQDN